MSDVDDQVPDVDLTRIATTAAEWMEYLEQGIRSEMEDGEDVPTVQTVAIVIELEWPARESNNNRGSTAIMYRCTDGRKWFQKGLFDEVVEGIRRSREPTDD